MREIKFRGKDINGKWIYGHYAELEESASLATPCIWQYGAQRATPISLETVGQYTSMEDSEGNEIYEGDILKVVIEEECTPNYDEVLGIVDYDIKEGSIQIGVVSYRPGVYEYNEARTVKGKSEGLYHFPLFWLKGAEVIGNIHDNPELLEGDNA